jgi:hypothetical protein
MEKTKLITLRSKSDLDKFTIGFTDKISPGLNKNFYKEIHIKIMNEEENKTERQNGFFHSLLQSFFGSGYSSFRNYDSARLHYKNIAGLIKYKQSPINIGEEDRNKLAGAFNILTLKDDTKRYLIRILRGEIIQEQSWSMVSKEDAKRAIDQLVRDCVESGAYGGNARVRRMIEDGERAGDWRGEF